MIFVNPPVANLGRATAFCEAVDGTVGKAADRPSTDAGAKGEMP